MRRSSGASGGIVTEALIYLRVSTMSRGARASLDAQRVSASCTSARHGWSVGEIYTDVCAGPEDHGPSTSRLLEDVKAARRPADVVVVVVALDRFGRKLLERVRCRAELKAVGVSTHSVREGGEVSDPGQHARGRGPGRGRRLGERVSRAGSTRALWAGCRSEKSPGDTVARRHRRRARGRRPSPRAGDRPDRRAVRAGCLPTDRGRRQRPVGYAVDREPAGEREGYQPITHRSSARAYQEEGVPHQRRAQDAAGAPPTSPARAGTRSPTSSSGRSGAGRRSWTTPRSRRCSGAWRCTRSAPSRRAARTC